MPSKLLGMFGKSKAETAEDPVCHMQVSKDKPGGGIYAYKDVTYYFCSPGCRSSFSKESEAYLSGAKRRSM